MRTKKILLSLLLSGLCLTVTQAQEFWFPNTPKDPNTTILRPGRTGIGIPTTSFNAFNTSTGRYTVADQVGLLVQGSNFTDVFNIGHLLTGDYGEEKVGDVWTAIGGPGNPNIAGLPLYGTRHQFDRYSVNMALTDRNIITGASGTSGIRDAIMFWDASPANNSRMYIGKTLGQGRISPDIVINPNGNVGIGTDAPVSKLDIDGNLRVTSGMEISGTASFSDTLITNEKIIINGGTSFNNPQGPRLEVTGRSGSSNLLVTIEDGTLGASVPNFTLGIGSPTSFSPFPQLLLGNRLTLGVIAGSTILQLGIVNSSGVYESGLDIREDGVSVLKPLRFSSSSGVSSDLIPTINLSPDIGSSTFAWDNVFADDFINVSDRRSKQKIEPLSYGLQHIQKLKPVTYQWKDKTEEGKQVGLIAQEVLEVIPEVVYDPSKDIQYDSAGRALPVDPDARYGIRYNELIPVMIKAMQEMSQKMEEQDTKIEEQQKIIAELTGENTREIEEGLGIDNNGSQGASVIELFQNTPNPFDQSTTIRYYLPEGTEKAQLFVYNIDGQQVRSMEITETGEGAMTITAGELGAGIYFYTLYADGEVSQTRKMILTE
ncbi:MAG: tail fiber domain-containing protein [Cytophagales bacterium]|nr:tail fiber domain-containing protein [Cytophagales bacterium]